MFTRSAPQTVLRRATLDTITVRAEGDGGEMGPDLIIASTAGVDRYGDIIDQESMKLDAYMRNPVILYGHEWDGCVVGNAVPASVKLYQRTGMSRPALGFSPTWDDHETNPQGRLVAHQWGTFLHAVSVGGYAGKMTPRASKDCPEWARGEYGYFIEGFELMEISVVPIPANTEVGAAKAAGLSSVSLADAVRDALLDPEFLAALRGAVAPSSPRVPPDSVESLFRLKE
jgi:hypothetical protein